MKAKKFLEKRMDGDIEIIKNHVIDIDVYRDVVEYVAGGYLEASDFDSEGAFTEFGVLMNEDGEPEYIKIGKFLDAIEKKSQEEGDELEPDDYEEMQKLKPYRDYELWVKS
jgi:hypothetical protein